MFKKLFSCKFTGKWWRKGRRSCKATPVQPAPDCQLQAHDGSPHGYDSDSICETDETAGIESTEPLATLAAPSPNLPAKAMTPADCLPGATESESVNGAETNSLDVEMALPFALAINILGKGASRESYETFIRLVLEFSPFAGGSDDISEYMACRDHAGSCDTRPKLTASDDLPLDVQGNFESLPYQVQQILVADYGLQARLKLMAGWLQVEQLGLERARYTQESTTSFESANSPIDSEADDITVVGLVKSRVASFESLNKRQGCESGKTADIPFTVGRVASFVKLLEMVQI
ncbi:hypothetical protein HDU97_000710 [Phlyctochytrium planicorne]|nr:hypothetical protein HDU97_000710 [Phlyctochytrium planicorne]